MPDFKFGDSLQGNIDLLGEIVSQMPREAHPRMRQAANSIERAVVDLTRGNRDPAVTLGVTLGLHLLAQHFVTKTEETKELLS